jgi:hypothetical protein
MHVGVKLGTLTPVQYEAYNDIAARNMADGMTRHEADRAAAEALGLLEKKGK